MRLQVVRSNYRAPVNAQVQQTPSPGFGMGLFVACAFTGAFYLMYQIALFIDWTFTP